MIAVVRKLLATYMEYHGVKETYAHAEYGFATARYVILFSQAQRNCEITFCLVHQDSLFFGIVPNKQPDELAN